MPAKFHFFTGDDEYLVEHVARDYFDDISKDASGDFAKEIIDATATKIETAEEALNLFVSATQTLSLLGDKKYVWFRGMNWLATDSQLGKSEGGKLILERLIRTLELTNPEEVKIVISAFPANGTRKETKWLVKYGSGTVINAAKDPAIIDKMINDECRKLGVSLDIHARHELVEKLDGNARMILSELDKLACFCGKEGGTITFEMISTLVPNFGEGNFFEPVEVFFTRNLEKALDALHRFFFNDPNAGRALLSALQNKNRLILQLRAAKDAMSRNNKFGSSERDIENAASEYRSYFGENTAKNSFNVFSQNPFYVKKIGTSAKHFTLKELINIQFSLVDCFSAMLDRPNEQEAIFREMFVRCLSSVPPGA